MLLLLLVSSALGVLLRCVLVRGGGVGGEKGPARSVHCTCIVSKSTEGRGEGRGPLCQRLLLLPVVLQLLLLTVVLQLQVLLF